MNQERLEEERKALQKVQTRQRVQRYRNKQKSVTLDSVTSSVTSVDLMEEQQRRFPDIPLPFGPAYYKALAEQQA